MLIPQIDRFTDHETIDCGALPVYDTVTFTADCVDAGMRTDSPRVLVLDGDNVNTLSVAREAFRGSRRDDYRRRDGSVQPIAEI